LLNNAIKFTKHGFVELGCDVENGKVVIYVKDTGIGIDEKHNEDVFKRFWQIDMTTTRTYGGNGLGLSICKELCEL
jgi:signal transduction histidine kinase